MKHYQCRYSPEHPLSLHSPGWQRARTGMIDSYPWNPPENGGIPKTQFRLMHSPQGLQLRFDVWERNIRATYQKPNDPVCRDSCVEFFFSPNANDGRYLSFEVNPLGTMLIGIGTGGQDLRYLDTDRSIFGIAATLQAGADFWQVSYQIPHAFIETYFAPLAPVFYGNFMKCADRSPTPHHGCWNPIGTPAPMFHVPAFFGKIECVKGETLWQDT